MKKFLPMAFLIFTLLFVTNCTSTKAQATTQSVKQMKSPSIEGTWELVSRNNYDGTEITGTIPATEGYRQIKMFYNGKVMWTRYVPDDSVEWFGYGTYKTTDNTLVERLEYMSASMRKIANENMEWNMELVLDKDKYSQIFIDEDGNRISAENYKRLD